ncbi:hypothetical protein, partial [Defluviitalea phaphyphila]|uniref:hypothetical protein n=1 Tax=Defluviitalea phaphyphila TaxID=1473580 RepID=UPI001A9A570C
KENTSSELTQEQFDLLCSYLPNYEKERQELIENHGKENIPKFANIAKNYMEAMLNFDYRMDFETYYNRALPYSSGTYNDKTWFKGLYDALAEHKLIMEAKFITDEYFVYYKHGGPEVEGLLLFRIKSVEGDFKEDLFGKDDYELGKWYQIVYQVEVARGLKGANFYGGGFNTVGSVMSVEGD